MFNQSDSTPLISIGITSFNAEETIERALLCARGQDWPNKEIIVVDDASTDGSRALLSELAVRYPEIKVIYHGLNQGFPAALNTIVTSAQGEFLAIFDDDDESAPSRLRKQWERIMAHERSQETDLVFCYTNRTVIPFEGNLSVRNTFAIGRQAPEPYGDLVADFILCQIETPPFVWGQLGSGTLMARRSTIQRIGGFDETFRRSAEWDLAVRLGLIGGHFIAVDQPLVTQHVTPGTEKSGKKPLRFAVALRKKHKDYLCAKGLYWVSLAQAHARFHYAKGNRWKQRFFTTMACVLAPRLVGRNILGQQRLVQYFR